MSDDALTVSAEDITVRKTVDTEQFQTVAVVLELTSDRDEIVRVQVVETVPDGVPMDDIGFHLDYGAEHWSVEDGTVVFERDIEPDEEYTTIYGVRDYPEDELEALRGEPDIGLIDAGAGDIESVVDEDRSDVIRDFLSGETELSGLEETIGAADDDTEATEPTSPEPDPTAEPESPADTEAEAEPEEAEAAESEPTPEPVEPGTAEDATPATSGEEPEAEEPSVPLSGGVVRVLIKELQAGDIDPEHRQVLRDELLGTEGTMEARVSHLQQRMSDLEAYTTALEEFIAEEGGAKEVLADIRSDIHDLEAEVQTSPDRLEEAIDRLEAVDDRVDTVTEDAAAALDRTEGLDDRLAAVEENVDEIDRQVEDLRAELDSKQAALEEEIENLEADLDELETFQERLKSVFGDEGGPASPP